MSAAGINALWNIIAQTDRRQEALMRSLDRRINAFLQKNRVVDINGAWVMRCGVSLKILAAYGLATEVFSAGAYARGRALLSVQIIHAPERTWTARPYWDWPKRDWCGSPEAAFVPGPPWQITIKSLGLRRRFGIGRPWEHLEGRA